MPPAGEMLPALKMVIVRVRVRVRVRVEGKGRDMQTRSLLQDGFKYALERRREGVLTVF